ncbi:unnamed protein product [Calypogeia fissa]
MEICSEESDLSCDQEPLTPGSSTTDVNEANLFLRAMYHCSRTESEQNDRPRIRITVQGSKKLERHNFLRYQFLPCTIIRARTMGGSELAPE